MTKGLFGRHAKSYCYSLSFCITLPSTSLLVVTIIGTVYTVLIRLPLKIWRLICATWVFSWFYWVHWQFKTWLLTVNFVSLLWRIWSKRHVNWSTFHLFLLSLFFFVFGYVSEACIFCILLFLFILRKILLLFIFKQGFYSWSWC